MPPVKCPTCRQTLSDPRSPLRPFCSRRCKLVDLGRWLDGAYAIPGEEAGEEDLEEVAGIQAAPEDGPKRRLH